ncbi:MAG TPA: hypothetical protein PLG58_02020 [Flexilinea sp.]|nr:hypothetical protein [Flexilinea sp.]
MKRHFWILSVILLLFMIFGASAQSEGDDQSRQTGDNLLKNSEKVFPRLLINEDFSENLPLDVYEDESNGIKITSVIQQKNGVIKATNYVDGLIKDIEGLSAFYSETYYGTLSEFHLHVEVSILNEFPDSTGSCFIEYTNEAVVGENSRQTVELILGSRIDTYQTKSGSRVLTTLYDLSGTHEVGKIYNIDIIRYGGIGYFFIDGVFLIAYQDNIKENLSWMTGPIVGIGGEQTTCIFDKIWVRRK